jgi:transketolase
VNYSKSLEKTEISVQEILNDYRISQISRQASILGRKEVFAGKAKFGIFGDGKELPQIAMAKVFQNGDFRAGYYRDQTFMLAIGELQLQHYYAQLYAHTDVKADPSSAGRLMNGHFSTRMLDDQGRFRPLVNLKNSTADVSPTAAQIPRLVGLGYASKLFRNLPGLAGLTDFSMNGNEVAFGTIGNAATAEGIFLEAINAIGVLQIPVVLSIWDDGYGISVPNEYQTTKADISKAMAGFQRTAKEKGIEIFRVKGWNYQALCDTYKAAAELARNEHVPCLIHVQELTQPLGHSTSGSHERYKTPERLEWEKKYDCNRKMKEWILENEFAYPEMLDAIEEEAVQLAKKAKEAAWKEYLVTVKKDQREALNLIKDCLEQAPEMEELQIIRRDLEKQIYPLRSDAIKSVRRSLKILRGKELPVCHDMSKWLKEMAAENHQRYNSHLYSQSEESALNVQEILPVYKEDSPLVDGREVLNRCFEAAFQRDPRVIAFGEDVGKIGDVNQGFAGLQQKFGEMRISDTGIRETTIIGQGIGMALRGLRPIAEIQYLDYLVFTLQTLTDDLACLHYRTKGGQKSPLIIRTRGHRLEGVWHSGSPMGMIINSLRGIHVLVPRNMTQAAGFYNTILRSDDPALIIESLNGYRLKERMPENIGDFTVPLGVPELLRTGTDITIVTYGSMCRIVMDAALQLDEMNISAEVIDVQSLLPFDRQHSIVKSLQKTNRILFADEDVPGGTTGFMMQQVLEVQQGYKYLDSSPATISSHQHRPAYGTDGDYFSKPNAEDVFDKVYAMMREVDPAKYPEIYRDDLSSPTIY